MTCEFDNNFYLIVKMLLITSQSETANWVIREPLLSQGDYAAVEMGCLTF